MAKKTVFQRIKDLIPLHRSLAELPARCKAAHEKYDAPGIKVFTPKDVIPDSATPYNTCMGKTIEKILECDEVIFAGWADSRGCRMEHFACENYGIPYRTDVKI